MHTSVRTKAVKKQSSKPVLAEPAVEDRALEQSILSLENICHRVLESRFTNGREDMDGLLWQRKFKNIVTPVSLALRECKGPRRFHFHYKHREDDSSVLKPVMENPVERLATVCREALNHSQTELVGIQSEKIVRMRDALEAALRGFVLKYRKN